VRTKSNCHLFRTTSREGLRCSHGYPHHASASLKVRTSKPRVTCRHTTIFPPRRNPNNVHCRIRIRVISAEGVKDSPLGVSTLP
jgi:hypothetical protein